MVGPEMVMLDEPMAGVNPALTQSLLGHIKDLREQGMTVLFVEHDMDMVRDISDWVIVMAQGQVIAEGPPDTVMADQAVIDAYLGAHHDQALTDTRRGVHRGGARRGRDGGAGMSVTPDNPGEFQRELHIDAEQHHDHEHGHGHGHPSQPVDRTAHVAEAEGALVRVDDVIAGYLPGVEHPQRLATSTPTRASWSASSDPTAPASRRCSRRSSAWSRSARAP